MENIAKQIPNSLYSVLVQYVCNESWQLFYANSFTRVAVTVAYEWINRRVPILLASRGGP